MLNIFTETPEELLSAISTAVDDGKFPQWKLDKDENFRFSGVRGPWRSTGKLSPRHYGVGVTFQYFPVRKGSLAAHIRARAMLHSRMLELLETHYHGSYSHVIFEPKPLPLEWASERHSSRPREAVTLDQLPGQSLPVRSL